MTNAPASGWRRIDLGAAGIVLAALALRLYRIDAQSAWVDEAWTVHAAASPWPAMMRQLVTDFNHPPLHTMVASWWFDVVHVGVLQARLLSALFGTAAVAALYWAGRQAFDRRVALIASALLAVSQLGIVYSQEARGYSLLLLLVVLMIGWYVRAFRQGRARDFAACAVAALLAIYTHYYAGFAIAALLATEVVFRRQSAIPGRWWAIAAAGGVIAYLPWLMSGVLSSALHNPQGATDSRWSAPLLAPLYALNWFHSGKINGVRQAAPAVAALIGGVLYVVPAMFALRGFFDGRDRPLTFALVAAVAVPALGVTTLGALHIVYDVRHISFALPPYLLLVARGLTMFSWRPLRAIWITALVGFTLLSLRADYFVPYKEDYRGALQIVSAQRRAGDCAVFSSPDGDSDGSFYWDAYHHDDPPFPIEVPAPSAPICQRTWLIWDTMWWNAGPGKPESLMPGTPAGRWKLDGVEVLLYEGK